MKLYTEEQVKKAIELAQEHTHEYARFSFDHSETAILEQIIHIELPIHEEIKDKVLLHEWKKNFDVKEYKLQFKNCLEIVEYFDKNYHTKLWHEQVWDLMQMFTVYEKNKQ